jgi:anaerobic selenocysteine-containing dehydrogenase
MMAPRELATSAKPATGDSATATATASRDSITDIWGPRTPHVGEWPIRVDSRMHRDADRWVRSVCVLCSTGCGMEIGVADGQIVGVRGLATDRVNHGRLGPMGLHAWEANHSPDRLTQPLVRDDGRLRPGTWEDAMGRIAERSKHDLDPGLFRDGVERQ